MNDNTFFLIALLVLLLTNFISSTE